MEFHEKIEEKEEKQKVVFVGVGSRWGRKRVRDHSNLQHLPSHLARRLCMNKKLASRCYFHPEMLCSDGKTGKS